MDSSIKKASLSTIALAVLAVICWLGLRGTSDPTRSSLWRQTPHAVEADPARADRRKPTGDPKPGTAVKRSPSDVKSKPLARKPCRRAERGIKKKQVYPES